MKNVCFFSLFSSLKNKKSKWLKEWSFTMSPKSLSEETLSIHWLSTVTVFHASLLYEFQHALIKKKVVILDHINRVTLSRKHTITFFLPFIFHNYWGIFLSFSLFISIWTYISHWQNRRKLWDSFLSCFSIYLNSS